MKQSKTPMTDALVREYANRSPGRAESALYALEEHGRRLEIRLSKALTERGDLIEQVHWFLEIMKNSGWIDDPASQQAKAILARLERPHFYRLL